MTKLVILGTAHLSSTPGKCSPDKRLREYLYSREICSGIQSELKGAGVNCMLDWDKEDMPGLNSSQELVKRVGIVNDMCKQIGTSNVMYVSVHVNAAGNGSNWMNATGFSIYTSKGTTKSDTLATDIYVAAEKMLLPLGKKLRKDMSDGDPDYEENFYVLKNTKCPAVLTENFFQDNKSDVEWLLSGQGKATVINYHTEGILNYLRRV